MSSTIGSLAISITAKIGDFSKGLAKARKDLNKFAQDIPGATVGVGAAFTALGAGAAVGLAAITHHQMEVIDNTAKMSDRLGIATEDLVGLQYAANLAGVGAEGFGTALNKMQKNLGEAIAGDDKAIGSFQQLGLNINDIANSSPDELFKKVADAIKGLHSPAQQTAAAMDIFGKSGADLIPIILSGSEGINAMQKEAADLGITFDRLDAAKVEEANDSLTRVWEVIKSIGNTLAIELAPFLTEGARLLVEFVNSGDGLKTNVEFGFRVVVMAVAKLIDYFELLKVAWGSIRIAFDTVVIGMVSGIQLVANTIDWLLDKTEAFTGIGSTGAANFLNTFVEGLRSEVKDAGKDIDIALANFRDNVSSRNAEAYFEGITKKSNTAAAAVAKVQKERQALNKTTNFGIVKDPTEDLKKLKDFGKKIQEETRSPLEKFKDKMEEIAKAFGYNLLGDNAEEVFKKAASMGIKELNSELDKNNKDKHKGGFRAIDSGLSIEGLKIGAQKQTVVSPQLEKANLLLQQIRDRLGIGGGTGGAVTS